MGRMSFRQELKALGQEAGEGRDRLSVACQRGSVLPSGR
jgi:hypothetical protein